jgi:hypothetical protein
MLDLTFNTILHNTIRPNAADGDSWRLMRKNTKTTGCRSSFFHFQLAECSESDF